jgi:Flp pilus assembly protein TadG
MANEKLKRSTRLVGFLTRLRKDVRGNTLALVAAALVPMIAMVGSGIDVSRMYLVKARLQQACDAGALAGRKQMGGGIWAQTTTPTPNTVARQFFAGNFKDGAYGTNTLTYAFTESSGDVTGTASVVVPMTMMKFFGMQDRTMSVTCDAQMQLPNTDVMFVLDNTGSMQSKANGSDPSSKIVTLKNAVKCFYESVAQLKTNGTCSTATSGNGVNSSSQIRFGFVPYTTNVNVGRLLPSSYFANSWPYQSREIASTSWGSWYNTSISCGSQPANSPTHQYQTITSNGSCKRIQERDGTITWRYFLVSKDITGLKNGSGWNNSFQLPINDDGTNKAISWDGCMEERKTIQSSGSPPAFTINSSNQVIAPNGQKMNDLDIDMLPSQSDSDSLWGPALTDIIYTRLSNGDYGSATTSEVDTTQADVPQNASYSCPTAAKKMQAWPDPAAFDTYVDSLATGGNTYHDIGLLWGARLMSPTGLFASENALTPQGGQIQRHMIFMTDGDTQTDPLNYTAYGVGWYDRRQTPSNTTPTGGSGEDGNLTQQVNGRFAALCTATKNKGITLWVISFGGSGIASQTKARLQACATDSNHYFDATSAASLDSAFQLIAAQITQLRLTK